MCAIIVIIIAITVVISGGSLQKESELSNSPVYEGIVQGKDIEERQETNLIMIGQQLVPMSDTETNYIVFVEDKEAKVSKEKWLQLEEGDTVYYQTYSSGEIGKITLKTDEQLK